MPAHDIYLSHRDLIERALALVCRKHYLSKEDAEDFSSTFRVHLMEHDYGPIRAFDARSQLLTFLCTIITNYFRDWQNARWGKWRPSTEAKRRGPLAVQLETMLVRDGLKLDEACETLRTNFGTTESRADLEAMAAAFPPRGRRTFVSDDVLADDAGTLRADTPLEEERAAEMATRAAQALETALGSLPDEDRVIIRMRFDHGTPVIAIAKALNLEQKSLYRRIEKILKDLRAALESLGVDAELCRLAFQGRGFDGI